MAVASFVHTADLHLSRPFGFLPPMLAEERRRDQRRTLTRIADLALEHNVNLLLVSGDLFDCPDPDPSDLEAVAREFARLTGSGVRIFAVPGNHDYAGPSGFWRRTQIEGLHVFLQPEWDYICLEDLGIIVAGIAFNRSQSERRAFQDLSLPSDIPSIVLSHASYEAFEGQLDRYHPFSTGDAAGTNASYIALGHYHRHNIISAGSVTACYPGTPEGISFDAPEIGDRYVIRGEVLRDARVKVEPMQVNRRSMKTAEIDCTSYEASASLFDEVRRACDQNAFVQLRLTGTPYAEVESAIEELTERFKDSCAYFTVDTDRLDPPGGLEADGLTIRGRFCSQMLQQIEQTPDPERRRLLHKALDLGISSLAGN